ncbi:LacI family DNA-binding transcriptional regulator [Thalassobellus sediminis]|uniref:LacI family DNA-binding transcriptional regulator n=1 Tax=Thalassobellus sediminis TaxID=3367753 RepID=UPI00379F3BED
MKKRTTITDVANKLKVTISTVSRALDDHPTISEKTKILVKKTVKELNYSPNKLAASLRSGKGNSIGVIVPKIDSNFMSSCISGIESVAYPAGYNLIICQSNETYKREIHNIQTLIDSQVSGIIMSLSNETKDSNHIQRIIDGNTPLVMFDRISDNLDIDFVVNDDYSVTKKAIKHLAEQGYKKIAYIGAASHIYVYKNRLNGYIDSLKEFNLESNDAWIVTNINTQEEAFEATKKMFKSKDKNNYPDAFFCTSDINALGTMLALEEMGIKTPDDVGVIGYANDQFSRIIKPSLSSIEQHPKDLGENSAKILLELLKQKNPSTKAHKRVVINPSLIIRQSSNRKP